MDLEIRISNHRRPQSERGQVLANPVFGQDFTDHMVTMSFRNGSWAKMRVGPFEDLRLSPAALALHYGQSIFEALKAYATANGDVALFRPDANARRMNTSAARIAMPSLPEGAFELACALLAEVDRDWVPTTEGAALYIRPFMFASEAHLSVRPAGEYEFVVIASPVASYFSTGLRAITVAVEEDDVRATPGGTGSVKFAGNYAAGFAAHGRAGQIGCDQVLWLDAVEHRWVEELNAMNVMFLWQRDGSLVLSTPPLGGTILEGITRDTILRIAGRSIQAGSAGTESMDEESSVEFAAVVERPTSIDDLERGCETGQLVEMFACGTAAVVVPIGTLLRGDRSLVVGDGMPGAATLALRAALLDRQYGRVPDPDGWMVPAQGILKAAGVSVD